MTVCMCDGDCHVLVIKFRLEGLISKVKIAFSGSKLILSDGVLNSPIIFSQILAFFQSHGFFFCKNVK